MSEFHDLADMGIHPPGLASPAAKSITGRNAMALVVPHRSARLASDSGDDGESKLMNNTG